MESAARAAGGRPESRGAVRHRSVGRSARRCSGRGKGAASSRGHLTERRSGHAKVAEMAMAKVPIARILANLDAERAAPTNLEPRAEAASRWLIRSSALSASTVPQHDLDDLRSRLERTRWSEELIEPARTTGFRSRTLGGSPITGSTDTTGGGGRRASTSTRQCETTIDGQHIHFLHVRSPEPRAFPLIMTHGWPGSIVEFLDVIAPLTNPESHGGDRPMRSTS